MILTPAAPSQSMHRRYHALALFYSHIGQSTSALGLWQQLGDGDLTEAPSSSGAVAEACRMIAAAQNRPNEDTALFQLSTSSHGNQTSGEFPSKSQESTSQAPATELTATAALHVAVEFLTLELQNVQQVSSTTVLQYLPWLLRKSGSHAVAVMTSRALPVQEMMPLLGAGECIPFCKIPLLCLEQENELTDFILQ